MKREWLFYYEDEQGSRTTVATKYLKHPDKSIIWKRLNDRFDAGDYYSIGYTY